MQRLAVSSTAAQRLLKAVGIAQAIITDPHARLDLAGMLPGVGPLFDAWNARLYQREGDLKNAAISIAAIAPYGGDLLNMARVTRKVATAAEVAKGLDRAADGLRGASRLRQPAEAFAATTRRAESLADASTLTRRAPNFEARIAPHAIDPFPDTPGPSALAGTLKRGDQAFAGTRPMSLGANQATGGRLAGPGFQISQSTIGNVGGSAGAMRRLEYMPSPKHGLIQRGSISPTPRNGQAALDFSIQVKPTSPRRVGIDYETGEYVVFDQTSSGVFHGHVRPWNELTDDMRNALRGVGIVDRQDRIL
jgi:hypothetical protein